MIQNFYSFPDITYISDINGHELYTDEIAFLTKKGILCPECFENLLLKLDIYKIAELTGLAQLIRIRCKEQKDELHYDN